MEVESKDLPYGECFVRFHEPRTLVLVNKNEALTGLFRVVPQDPSTYPIARVSPEPEEGQVQKVDCRHNIIASTFDGAALDHPFYFLGVDFMRCNVCALLHFITL